MTLEELADRLATPIVGPKGSAGFYLPACFAVGRRGKSDAIAPAALVMVDLDFGAWTADTIRAAIPEPIAYIAHTTASHAPRHPKWRVIFPLGVALDPDDWKRLARALSRLFGYSEGVKGFDSCGEKISQPIYWPTKATEDAPFTCDGDIESAPIGKEIADRLIADEKRRESIVDKEARRECEARERARRDRAERFGNARDQADVIARFNASHPIESMLERYGYTPPPMPGGRWLSPNSAKGVPAVRVFPDEGRFYSHHASDQGTEFEHGDAFDLFRLYQHGGDFTKAVRAAAVELGVEHEARMTVQNRTTSHTAGDAPAKAYPLISFGDILATLDEDYLVKGIIARGEFAALIGASGSTKTFLALEVAIAIASGTRWRGLRTRRARVVYIAAEGARGIQNRLAAMRNRLALGDAQSVLFHMVPDVVRLTNDSDDVDRLLASIRETLGGEPVDLVVIDTLSRAIAGRDENSSADMTAAISAADRIRGDLGATVLLVHHSGKDESRGARGHSSLRAALDTEIEVRKLGDSFSLTLTKSRDHESGRVFHHRLEVVEVGNDADGEPVTSCVIRPIDGDDDSKGGSKTQLNAHEQRILRAIRALLPVEDGTARSAPDCASKSALREWVERNQRIPHSQRRNVVLKGLKGLESKGIVKVDGERVFLVRDDD